MVHILEIKAETHGSAVNRPKHKPPAHTKKGSVGFGAGKGPRHVDGNVVFDDEEEVTIEIEGRASRKARLRKLDINSNRPGTPGEERQVLSAVYADTDSGIICRHDCSSVECKTVCKLGDTDGEVYMSGGKALVMEYSPGILPEPVTSQGDNDGRRRRSLYERPRRSIAPDLSQTGVIKIIFFPDKSVMDIFLNLVDGNVSLVRPEVTSFLTLSTNEMTTHLQSIKNHGENITVLGVTRPLDLAVHLVDIVFPPENATGSGFDNVAWSEESISGDYIQFITNVSSGSQFGLESFRLYLRDNFTTSLNYDFAIALSDYPIEYFLNGNRYVIQGIAWGSSVCDLNKMAHGSHSTLVTVGAALARIVSHELGHGLGSNHDSGACSGNSYIMSAGIASPTVDNIGTLFNFSNCSVVQIRDHFNGIADDNFSPTCLYDTSLTDAEFRQQFCDNGLLGASLTLLEICKIGWGPASYVCGNHTTLRQNNYVEICSANGSANPVFCKHISGACYPIYEIPPGTKCSVDGTLGSDICFEGNCLSPFDLCTTTTPPTTTTTNNDKSSAVAKDNRRNPTVAVLFILATVLLMKATV